MLLRLAEALWAVHAVLDAAAVDGVVVLVVQQQWGYHNHICTVRHRVAEVAQLTVVTGHNCFRITVAGICWEARNVFFLVKQGQTASKKKECQGSGVIILVEVLLITLAGAGWVRCQLFAVFGRHMVSLPTFFSPSPVDPCRIGVVWANSAPYAHSVSLFIVLQKLC